MSMYPRLMPGRNLLLDRHDNSLKPYRKGEFNMYAVLKDGTCTLKYRAAANHLILRPHNQDFPIEVLTMEEGRKAAHYSVGRACHEELRPRRFGVSLGSARKPGFRLSC